MLNHLPRDNGHIRYLPCENIQIFSEKSDEREFLFEVELRAEMKLLVGVVWVHLNVLACGPFLLIIRWLIGGWLV
jgi:hypothetical protein